MSFEVLLEEMEAKLENLAEKAAGDWNIFYASSSSTGQVVMAAGDHGALPAVCICGQEKKKKNESGKTTLRLV